MTKKLRFETLELLSNLEKRARKIYFHPHLTIIKGENDVGKSSIIKSLYWAFGASPKKIHQSWKKAKVKALVTFSVDETRYRILRDGDYFAIFDKNDKNLLITDKITKDLAKFFSDLLDFRLLLPNRKTGEPETPPPAYAFLPFYLDQDDGWMKPFDSFHGISQYANFEKSLIEFHVGILPKEYYKLEANKRKLQISKKSIMDGCDVLEKAFKHLEKMIVSIGIGLELSSDEYEQIIKNLLTEMKQIRTVRQDTAKRLAEIQDQRMLIEQQILVVKHSIKERGKDIVFARDLPEEVICPTCGSRHGNNFANRYSIAADREACFEFLVDAHNTISNLTQKAIKAETNVRDMDKKLNEIQRALNIKKNEFSLNDIIKRKGEYIALNLLKTQYNEKYQELIKISQEIVDTEKSLRAFNNKNYRNKVIDFYSNFVKQYLTLLDVQNYNIEKITQLPAKISETGSDQPRALLAYFLALLQTIHKYSTFLLAPIIIDSPNQQDQDIKNMESIIDLITNNLPDDAQIILGTVSLYGRTIKGKTIELTEKSSVLRSEEFNSVKNSIQPYINALVI